MLGLADRRPHLLDSVHWGKLHSSGRFRILGPVSWATPKEKCDKRSNAVTPFIMPDDLERTEVLSLRRCASVGVNKQPKNGFVRDGETCSIDNVKLKIIVR